MLTKIRLASAAMALAALAAACTSSAAANAPDPSDTLSIAVPPVLAGLTVTASKKATDKLLGEARGRNSYLRDASVFELRKDKELRAVFEVVRLTSDAHPEEKDFRKKIVQLIGGGSRAPDELNGQLVYTANVNQQIISVWFQSRFMEVLIVRENPTVKGQATGVNANQLLAEATALRPVRAA